MKLRFLLLIVVLFALFPTALVPACKVVLGALLQLAADLAGVSLQ